MSSHVSKKFHLEKIKKKVSKIFKVSNLGRTKFLNVTFDLKSCTYYP